MRNAAHQIYSFDKFTLDLTRGCLRAGREEIKLRPKSFDVLTYFLENNGRLIGKDELIDSVWEGMAVTDDSLVQCLRDIRFALGDDAQQIIKTVPRRGYIFDKEVSRNGASVYSEETSGVRLVIEETIENGDGDEFIGKPQLAVARRSLIGAVKRHKWATALALVSIILTGGGIAYGLFVFFRQPAAPPFRSVSVKPLTTEGNVVIAAISPDGKYVAYVAEKDGRQSLWVRQVVATNGTQIVEPAEVGYTGLTFSPDGNFIYYVHSKSYFEREKTLYQVPTFGGGTTRKLFEGMVSPVAISPDGKRLAFVRGIKGQGSSLMLANADGIGEPEILAARKPPDFFTMFPNYGLAWSPDGKTIVISGGEGNKLGAMYPIAVSIADGTQTVLTDKKWYDIQQVTWLADGSGFIMNAGDNRSDANLQLWHISFPGGVPTRIYNDFNNYYSVSMAANSDTLAAVQSAVQSNIRVITLSENPEQAAQLTYGTGRDDGFWQMATTPDGRIVYDSKASNSRELWLMDADGSNQKQLTFDSQMEFQQAVSPDGRYLVYVSGDQGIWRMEMDGSNRQQLSKGGMFPRFTPDGQWIYYTGTGWKMRRMPADGGASESVTNHPAVHPAISPDGKLLAFVEPVQSEIRVIPLTGGEPVKVFKIEQVRRPYDVHWTPDGTAVNYNGFSDGIDQIWSLPLDGSPPKVLVESRAEQIRSFTWSPDGKKLFFASGPVSRNVVIFNLSR